MSCYVCSTIEFDNQSDNPCRHMRMPAARAGFPIRHQYLGQAPSSTTTTTTTTTSTVATVNAPISATTTTTTTTTNSVQGFEIGKNYSEIQQPYQGQKGLSIYRNESISLSSDMIKQQQQQSSELHSDDLSIRTRQCFDDENFCSIVSVVRVEFSNDSFKHKFWALER